MLETPSLSTPKFYLKWSGKWRRLISHFVGMFYLFFSLQAFLVLVYINKLYSFRKILYKIYKIKSRKIKSEKSFYRFTPKLNSSKLYLGLKWNPVKEPFFRIVMWKRSYQNFCFIIAIIKIYFFPRERERFFFYIILSTNIANSFHFVKIIRIKIG